MDVSGTTSTTSTTSSKTATSSGTTSSDLTSDFDTYLRMLTTQMKNQDPTNPMDASDFAVQLATFSGVEQQVKTNQILTAMQSTINSMGLTELSGWIGKYALVDDAVAFAGAPVTLEPSFASGATSAKLVVSNSQGEVVQTVDLPIEEGPVAWAGVNSNGESFPTDNYTFTVESYSGEDLLSAETVPAYGYVAEARPNGDGIDLVLDGGTTVSASSVIAIRAAAS